MVRKDSKEIVIGILRISLGFIFFWAFIDKLFGLGFSTARDKAVIFGNSPTLGFLSNGAYGPFSFIYKSLAGNLIIDIVFMAFLLIIGVTLILGIGVRYGSFLGILLMFLIWTARLPPTNNPIIDEHIIYILIFIYLMIEKNHRLSLWRLIKDEER